MSSERGRLDDLIARHREPHRRYHGVAHLVWIVRHVLELAVHEPVDDLGAVVAAACYHDAVYVPTDHTHEAANEEANEEASARLAAADLAALGWAPDRIDRVRAMITATAHHHDPADCDTAVLVDADLAVLAADPSGYDEYARGVRSEYAHVADDEWRVGRAAVLHRFLDRDRLYSTPTARERWEHRARANLAAELATLRT